MFWRLFCPDRWVKKGVSISSILLLLRLSQLLQLWTMAVRAYWFDLSIGRNKNLTARLGSAWYTRH
jgi:hypothetical protein